MREIREWPVWAPLERGDQVIIKEPDGTETPYEVTGLKPNEDGGTTYELSLITS